jgi:amino acid transporter
MPGQYPDPAMDPIEQLLPFVIFQLIYAVVTFLLCRKQNWNAWLWAIVTLIPLIGMIAFVVILFLTLLNTLNRLNELEGKGRS